MNWLMAMCMARVGIIIEREGGWAKAARAVSASYPDMQYLIDVRAAA